MPKGELIKKGGSYDWKTKTTTKIAKGERGNSTLNC